MPTLSSTWALTADPAYVALRESFLDARRLTCLDRAAPILDAMAGGALPPIAGPLAIMLVRANDVGIAWSPDEQQFIDEFGLLALWGCCPPRVGLLALLGVAELRLQPGTEPQRL